MAGRRRKRRRFLRRRRPLFGERWPLPPKLPASGKPPSGLFSCQANAGISTSQHSPSANPEIRRQNIPIYHKFPESSILSILTCPMLCAKKRNRAAFLMPFTAFPRTSSAFGLPDAGKGRFLIGKCATLRQSPPESDAPENAT